MEKAEEFQNISERRKIKKNSLEAEVIPLYPKTWQVCGCDQTWKLTAAGNPGIRYLSVPSPDHSHSSSPSRQLENTLRNIIY